MKINLAKLLLAILALSPIFSIAQRGKDGNYTVTATNTIVNSYTYLTADAAVNATSITVNSNTLSGGAFAGNLAAGDLIMIIQMQGATMDINTYPVTGWGGNYTVPQIFFSSAWDVNPWEWGQVTAMNNAGKYEQVEVLSVSGANTINLSCGLQNAYTSSGHVQIVRVPRFNDLTLNTSTSIVPTAWGGQIGGVVAVEVNGNLVLNASSRISASARGFRGAVADNVGSIGSTTPHTKGNGNGASALGSTSTAEGGRKGEGIGGYTTEYDALFSRYGRGAPANGGGGGGFQNAGGGGGSNIGSGAYTGKGIPSTTFAASTWNLELAGFAGSSSPGGGRGGYSLSSSNQDELTLKPNMSAWSADARKENGGLGGHPLAYDATRLFMGGGGGAGDQDSGQGGAGGNGGGIVHITCYGTISGTGTVESDGAIGQNTNPNNQTATFGQKKGNDGAGGGGGGGSIVIKNGTALPASVGLFVRGGNGGNHALTLGTGASSEASGPGGGGSGGAIAFSAGTPTQTATGGISGTSNSTQISNFNVNGATNGAAGTTGLASPFFNITANNATICAGLTASLTATVTGTLPGTLSWYAQQFGGSPIATGTTFTTPVLNVTTTYYVGVCPGTFRVPVVVTVNPRPTISGTAVVTNPTCAAPGSITGLTVSGGTPAYTISWTGTAQTTLNITNLAAGTYTLTVSDQNSCSATSGPYTLVGTGGPIIDASGVTIVNQSCTGTMGSISGITATGTATLTYSWTNGGGSAINATNLTAGSYTLTVTDGNGCTATAGPYTVNFIAGPSVNAAGISITPATCGNANGAISGITATGTGLSYTWNGTASVSTSLSGQNGGAYTLIVTDGNGCTASSGPHTIPSIAGPTINSAAVTIVNENCGLGNGSISGITVSGGTPTLTNSWTGTAQTTLDLTNLSAGSYTLTVTDQNSCVATAGPFTVLNTGGPVINAASIAIQNESCTGTLGSITGITATGVATLSYSWSNGGGTNLNATSLTAGTYSLTVTDGNGCSATSGPHTVGFISGPSVDATAISITPATCGNANGAISGITASGTGLSYTWNGTASASTALTGQNGGAYSLIITDANGCTATSGPHTIPSIAGPTINSASAVVVNENCGLGNGSISGITVSGGTPTLINSWTGTAQTTLDLTNLSAGSYTLTVTDQNSCVATAGPFTISNIGGPVINTASVSIQDQSCNGTMGSITGITATGVATLGYSWSNGGGTNVNATNLTAGTYSLTVTDGNGCTATAGPYTVNYISGPSIDDSGVSIATASCGNAIGSITGITATGTGLSYSWNGVSSPTIDLTGQNGGNYVLVVTDANGCSDFSGPHTIPSSTAININLGSFFTTPDNCNSVAGNGAITQISVSGGSPGYTYSWTGTTQTTLDINGLIAGDYELTVTDLNNCTASTGIIVVDMIGIPVLNETSVVLTNVACDATLGSITGITANGIGLTYSWSNGGGTSLDATNLSAGDYVLTVTNGNGCSTNSFIYTITAPVPLAIDATNMVVTETACTSNTGSISGIVITGGINPVYSWSNSATSLNISSLAAGNYTLSVTDDQGCADDLIVPITMVNAPVIDTTAMVITSEHCGQNDATVTGITVSGGTPTYTYSWNTTPVGNTIDLADVSSGTVTLTVTDSQGCSDAETITISEIGGPVVNTTNIIVQQPTCLTTGSISGITVNGVAPYSYTWTATTQTTLDITNLSDGSYSLTVEDGNGCIATFGPTTLVTPTGPTAAFVWNPASPDVDEVISFTNSSTGANIILDQWTIDGQTISTTDITYTFTQEGDYPVTLYVADQSGCVDSVTQIITVYGVLVIPNVMTINGDNVNEMFEIKGLKPNTSLIVVNRWGNIVLETDDYKNDWNGKDSSGNDLTEGVYTYILKTANGKTEHGFVHLIRK